MSTTSTENIVQALRTQLLTYSSSALSTLIGGRLYIDAAPDQAVFEYGIMRLINRAEDQNVSVVRETPDLELMLFAKSRSRASTLEGIADACDLAMTNYVDASSGLMRSRVRQRDTIPTGTDPADREIVQIRLLYGLTIYPLYLNQ